MKYLTISIILITMSISSLAINNDIYKMIDSFDGFVGVYMERLDDGKVLFEYNCERKFIPASVTKLFVILTSLEIMGKDYVYETKFYYTDGNLGIKGDGDPLIYPSTLRSILENVVKKANIKQINNIIIDDYLFKRKEIIGKGWMWDDPNPPIGALVIKSHTCVNFQNLTYPFENFYKLTRSILEDMGVNVKGKLVLKRISKTKKPVYVYKSQRLKEILSFMIKNSDNQIAEMIFRKCGAVMLRKGTINNAIAATIKVVKKATGYGINDFTVVDGPGLSRYNLVSPKLIVEIIRYMYEKYGDDFLNILSHPKYGGTLQGRFDFDVWGKTGTMKGVSGLSGILKTKLGNIVLFSILENNFLNAKADAKQFENNILEYAYENF